MQKIQLTRQRIRQYLKIFILGTLIYLLFSVSLFTLFGQSIHQQFIIQSESFLQGRLDLIRLDKFAGDLDTYKLDDKYYWPLGPFPSIAITPVVLLLREGLRQGHIQYFLNILIFALAVLIAKRRKGFSWIDSLYLGVGFVFGSVYVLPAFTSHSWYFSHAFTVVLLLLAIWEFTGRKRMWLIGLIYAALMLTRVTAALTLGIVVLDLLFDKRKSRSEKLNNLISLGWPLLVGLGIYLWFNYARYGNALDIGYQMALVRPELYVNMRREFGLFSPRNILSNIYIYFLMPLEPVFKTGTNHLIFPFLQPNPVGLSFFIVAPIYARLIWFRKMLTTKEAQRILLVTLGVVFILLNYYASGLWQLGPRYLLDVFPWWYLLLFSTFRNKRLTKWDYVIIALSCLANLYIYHALNVKPSFLYWRTVVVQ